MKPLFSAFVVAKSSADVTRLEVSQGHQTW